MKQIVEILSNLTYCLQEGLDLATVEIPILNDCEHQVQELAKELALITVYSEYRWLILLKGYFEAKRERERKTVVMLSKRPNTFLDADLVPALEEVSILFSNTKKPKQKYKGVAIKPKHPRNAPCHCGSGKKFKKCCNL